jgi:hypothetical protein
MSLDYGHMSNLHSRLMIAIEQKRSFQTCLRYWGDFVKGRDADRCIICQSDYRIAAHHIVRKTFLPYASLNTGNGITLCESCHRHAHIGFNGRPDVQLPMDAQNGEKIELLAELYTRLLNDAEAKNQLSDEWYFLSDEVLLTFMRLQGFVNPINFVNSRLAKAVAIWRYSPSTMRMIMSANGVEPTPDVFITGSGVLIWS